MTKLEEMKAHKCFGGWLKVFAHDSDALNCRMECAVYLPPQAETQNCPVLYWLSGLTCTWANFIEKAGAQKYAADHGIILVIPDTSPRGVNIEGEDESYDFGSGAGFYLDATQKPWSDHYHMYSYITKELPGLINELLPSSGKASISGHSMGGHGALICALKNSDFYKSVSAFAPIVNPCDVPWGQKAFSGYLGDDRAQWEAYDASRLAATTKWAGPILIDQGTGDNFLNEQLQPEIFKDACDKADLDLTLRMQDDYDHSYFFISTFIGEHISFHAKHLKE